MSWAKAEQLRKIAKTKGLDIDDETLLAVQQNNGFCLCNMSRKCPCKGITNDGCECGLFRGVGY